MGLFETGLGLMIFWTIGACCCGNCALMAGGVEQGGPIFPGVIYVCARLSVTIILIVGLTGTYKSLNQANETN